LTKASLYVYFGPVAVLVCRRFDHTPMSRLAVCVFDLLNVQICYV